MKIRYTGDTRLVGGMYVEIYYNLREKDFSVKYKNKVIAYVDHIAVQDGKFFSQKAGRERVREEGCKNVHAGVRGHVIPYQVDFKDMEEAYYNPYKVDSFVNMETREAVHKAGIIVLDNKKVYYS